MRLQQGVDSAQLKLKSFNDNSYASRARLIQID